ncbi:HAD family hydrolase [Oceanobacillus neutriphilus]|uniref:Haloacid dehalogenase n=1 Tax=Oceanobacillus neutriphilus TaxID=531815 RepID=A0ABQ2NN47_9BACI|nr:HAD-IA family hydrolase [Oceanobacillus neutriphilus]GGP07043.1 haloacid dehalogenase [Oceanobacillus neutriphilus]
MIKAAIFDFDGLILDTETAWFDAYKEVLRSQFQFDLPLGEFVKCVGSDDTILFSYLQNKLNSQLNVQSIRDEARKLHSQFVRDAKAREGVTDYLKDAKDEGLTVALATSSTTEWATTHLTNLNLLSYFDFLVTQDMVERVKPAPDIFLKTLEKLDLEAREAVVFEDSLNGLIAAQEVDLPTVIIPNPVTAALPFENYHLKLNSMTDMPLHEILKTLNR